MAIRGGLTEFSVPELLQLLNLQQKTGVLTFTHSKGHIHVIFFDRGRVMAAVDRRQSGRHHFLAYLLQNQILAADQIESVEDICRGTGHDLFTVIVTSGVMSRDRLMEEMHRFAQRIMDELVNWTNGTYDFSPHDEKSLPSQGVVLRLNPEELILESMRRTDELATMKESMLAPDLLLAPVPEGPGQPLPRECTVVLNLVDGIKSIDEICRISPLGEYLTYDAISELLGRQLIMIVNPEDAHHLRKKRKQRPTLSVPALAAMVSLLIGSALLGTGLKPLLNKSRGESTDWMANDAAQRRDQIRVELTAQVRSLMEPSNR